MELEAGLGCMAGLGVVFLMFLPIIVDPCLQFISKEFGECLPGLKKS
jgi:hypothetical protein